MNPPLSSDFDFDTDKWYCPTCTESRAAKAAKGGRAGGRRRSAQQQQQEAADAHAEDVSGDDGSGIVTATVVE